MLHVSSFEQTSIASIIVRYKQYRALPSRSIQRAVGKHTCTQSKAHTASAWQRYEEKGHKRTTPPSLEDEGAHLQEVMPGPSLKGKVGISQVNRRWEMRKLVITSTIKGIRKVGLLKAWNSVSVKSTSSDKISCSCPQPATGIWKM